MDEGEQQKSGEITEVSQLFTRVELKRLIDQNIQINAGIKNITEKVQLLETEQEKLKKTKEVKMKENNDMVSDLVRQIIYLRKCIEIQELQNPQADQTHVHNLIGDNQGIFLGENPNKTRRKKRDNRESKTVKHQFSI